MNAIKYNEYGEFGPMGTIPDAEMVAKYIDGSGYERRTRREYATTVMIRDEVAYGGRDMMDLGREKAYKQLLAKLKADGYPEGAIQIDFTVTNEPGGRLIRIFARAVVFEEDKVRMPAADATNMWVSSADQGRKKYFNPDNQPINPNYPLAIYNEPPPDMDGPVRVRRAKITEG